MHVVHPTIGCLAIWCAAVNREEARGKGGGGGYVEEIVLGRESDAEWNGERVQARSGHGTRVLVGR